MKDFISRVSEKCDDLFEDEELSSWIYIVSNVFACTHDGIMVTDPDGAIVEVNPAFSEITGYHRDEVIGKTPSILSSGRHDPAYYDSMWSSVRTHGRWNGEIVNKRKDGELLHEFLTISAIAGQDGRVTHYIGLFSDVSQAKRTREELDYLAHFDALTGLPNRLLLKDRLVQAVDAAKHKGTLIAICHLELNDFSVNNSDLGYEAGDIILQTIGARLQDRLSPGDTVARIGDDDFVLLLADLDSVDAMDGRLRPILSCISAPIELYGGHDAISISAKVGATLFPNDGDNPDRLLRNAAQALLHARDDTAGAWNFFDKLQQVYLISYRQTLNLLKNALEADEFTLFYQPKVDLVDGSVRGMEALIRWPTPDGRIRTPGDFLPLLHSAELAPLLDEWVLRTALKQMQSWRDTGFEIPISVNVSAGLLMRSGLDAWLFSLFSKHANFQPKGFEIEIVESTAIENIGRAAVNISACCRMGVSFSLDDFGTGYSSLTYLKSLPVSTVKIDHSFVGSMLEDPASHAIVRGVIGMAAALGREVVAEGAETGRHIDELRRHGCRIAQGYAISEPMPAHEVERWVRGAGRVPAKWIFNKH